MMLIWSAVFLSLAALSGLFGLQSIGSNAEPIARSAFLIFFCMAVATSAAGYWTEKRLHHHIH